MASEIRIDKISAAGATSDLALESTGGDVVLNAPGGRVKVLKPEAGTVVQKLISRVDTRTSYSGSNFEITDLRLGITPKYVTSMVLITFYLFGEAGDHNTLFTVYKNGSVPAGLYPGYNAESGDVSWSGLQMAGAYPDTDYNSTPHGKVFLYHDFPATLTTVTYAPGFKVSDGGSSSYYLNRTIGSTGQGNYETGVSFTIIEEIAQ